MEDLEGYVHDSLSGRKGFFQDMLLMMNISLKYTQNIHLTHVSNNGRMRSEEVNALECVKA